MTGAVGAGALTLGVEIASRYIYPWTGRFYSLLDPMYAKDHIPIIASILEHQPISWSSFIFDYHILSFFFPVVCLISAIAISVSMKNLATWIHNKPKYPSIIMIRGPINLKESAKVLVDQALPFQRKGACVFLFGVLYLLTSYVTFYTWVTSKAYSSLFIVLATRGARGDRVIFK